MWIILRGMARQPASFILLTDKNIGGSTLRNSFSIQMTVDPRDAYAEELYQAYLLQGPNPYILIKVPGQNSSFRLDHAFVGARGGPLSCPRVQEAVDLNCNAVERDGKRVSKHILLNFPSYMTLSNDIYSPGTTCGKINDKVTLYSLKTVLRPGGNKITMLMCRLAWKVNIVERTVRQVEVTKPQGKSRLQVLRVCIYPKPATLTLDQ